MVQNLISLLGLLVILILAVWLTLKAFRIRTLWLKILSTLGAGLLTLILAALTVFGSLGFKALYFPNAPAAPDLKVAGTPEQLARGQYLANISCIGCHSAVDGSGNPTENLPLSGGWNIGEAEGFGFVGSLVAENLTPGGKLAGYTDGEIFRALRHGIDKDGHLLGIMPLLAIGELSNADLEALVAYLRTQPAVANDKLTGDSLHNVGLVFFGAGLLPQATPRPEMIVAPPQGISAEYGEYVSIVGDCRGCHGPGMRGMPAGQFRPAYPNPRPLVSMLSIEEFTKMMRTGIKPDGKPFPDTMPWQNASRMSDDDLAALYAYLSGKP